MSLKQLHFVTRRSIAETQRLSFSANSERAHIAQMVFDETLKRVYNELLIVDVNRSRIDNGRRRSDSDVEEASPRPTLNTQPSTVRHTEGGERALTMLDESAMY